MRRIAIGLGLIVLVVLSASVVLAAQGGPDAGGYTYINNVGEPAGPVFSYTPLAAGDIGSSCDDCVVSGVAIGFTFNFYGAPFTTMNVSSNGNIQFTTANAGFTNPTLPSAGLGAMIAPYFDDLRTDCSAADRILVETSGSAPTRRTTVEWQMTPFFNSGCPGGDITFQAVLFESSNHILFLYPDVVPGNGGSATVGIQRDGATALQYSFNSAVITNGLAICFRPPTVAFTNFCSTAPLPATFTPTATITSTVVVVPPSPTPLVRPNIGPAIGAILAGNAGDRRAATATVQAGLAAQAAAQPAAGAATIVRPPSTGDAGLGDGRAGSPVELALLLPFVLAYLGVLRAVWIRAKG